MAAVYFRQLCTEYEEVVDSYMNSVSIYLLYYLQVMQVVFSPLCLFVSGIWVSVKFDGK